VTPLRQRFIEDMQLRNLCPATQRNYAHHLAGFAKYFDKSPDQLDIEAVRQYQLYLLNERKLSAEAVNQYISSVKFLYLTTLEAPWTDEYSSKLPVVLSQEEMLQLFDNIPSLKYRAALLRRRTPRSGGSQRLRYRLPTHAYPRGQRPLRHAVPSSLASPAPLL
jgi:integrase/recombinase XerD